MIELVYDTSMSLDGFITGPDPAGGWQQLKRTFWSLAARTSPGQ
jgi:hypothetical protein